MSNAVAKVSFLQGQAWAKTPDGTLRALKVGSTLNDDEVLVTAQGTRIELDVGTGEPLVVNGGMEVGMSRDFRADTATDADEALLSDASVQEALTVLEQGGDLLEELEETAAGNTGGGGGSEGHDFVQLTRVIEGTNPQAFDYSPTSGVGQAAAENDADYINRAPLVTDQVIASNEDETVTGQIIADDIEDDALTFTLTTQPVNGTLVLDPVTGQFTFVPKANYNGPDSFVVTVTDSRGNSTNTSITLNIAPVNDAPTTNDINLTTDEDVPVNGQVVAQDIENDALNYVVSGQPANGTVVIDPATGAFVYSPNANVNGSDSFVVTISDGNGGTTTSTVTIGINSVNDAPMSSDQNLVTDEDTPIDGQVLASDVDGDALGYSVSGQPANGTVVLNPATGGFVYTPNANYNGSDSFVVTISDGNGGTTTSLINIGVTPVNDAPVSSDQNLSTPEDTPLPGQVVATDIEGDTLGYVISGQPTNGSVTLNSATGSFVYTPNANYNGSDSFVVTISDGNGGTTTSTVNIGVTPVNDAPVSSDQNLTTSEDTPLPGQVVATDIEGNTLGYVISGQPTNGSVTLNSATGSFVYTPNANYNGSDSFVVTISDGNGGTTTSLINIGVTPVNDAPVSSDQNLTTPEDIPLPGQVVATDIEGDTLGYVISGQPTNGSVTLNSATGGFVYTPNVNYNGSDSFVVTISDGNGGTTTSRVNIGVTPVNDAPVAGNQNLSTPEDTPINGQISASDIDGGSLGYSISGSPANGSVTLNPATGIFVYTPNTGYNGSDSFVVTISDGNGGTTTSRVNIGVTPVNDAPVANNDIATTDEATAVTVAVRANDTDPDANPLTVTGVTQGANGSVVIDAVTGNPIYTPNAGFVGSDNFTYTINDGNGGFATATVTVTVNSITPVNTAPVAVTESIDVAEGGTATVLVGGATSVLTNDTDAENNPLTAILISGPTNGTLTLNADGTFSYVHDGSETTSDSFSYKVNDGTVDGNTVTVVINVAAQNNAPVAVTESINVAEGGIATVLVGGATSVLTNDTDAENDPLTAILVTGPTNGTLTLNANGTFSYTHNGSETTTDSFTYKVNDGTVDGNTVTVAISVTPVNDAPVAINDTVTTTEGSSVTVAVRGNDTDAEGNTLTVSAITQGANGLVVIDAVTGSPIYTPNAGFSGSDSFTYTISDGSGGTATATVNVTVDVNQAPVAVDDFYTTNEDTPIVINVSDLLGNDYDPEGATLSLIGIPSLTNGTLSYNGSTITFYPNPNFNGVASFQYRITDGTKTDIATVNITVNPVDDPTNMAPENRTVAEDSFITGNVLSNDSDIETPVLQVASYEISGVTYTSGSSTLIPGIGTLLLNTDGTFRFDPVANYNGPVPVITYTTNTGSSSTLTIAVTPVNDAPVAVDDSYSTNQDTPIVINISDLLGNDVDIDGDSLSLISIPGLTNGTLSYNGTTITFYPNPGFSGLASFQYRVSDGSANDVATVNINVAYVNQAPETTALTATGDEDALVTINLAGTDTDGSVTGFVIKSLPANGVLYSDAFMTAPVALGDLVAGPVYFMPNANWNGATNLTYAAEDNQGLEDATPATFAITINPVADSAILSSGTGTVKEDTPAQSSVSGVLTIVDPDAGQAAFQAQTNTPGTYGTFSISSAGDWIYSIDNSRPVVQALKEGEAKTETFTVTSIDGTTTSVVITVNGTNDGPIATVDTAIVNQDAVLTLTAAQLLANDTDPDLDTLTIDSVQGAVNGSVSMVGGNVVFTPTPGYYGPASFTYTVTDGNSTSTATVSITVEKANTAPVANDDEAASISSGNVGLISEYFGYQEPTDGANLASIQQVYAFINGRAPNATFIAKTFDYSAATFANGLGTGTNLQTFLGSDAASLSADPATTTDAIIRMRGFVDLGAGTYNFKILADDGYQIRVDGVVVGERNLNQSATTTTHGQFTLSAGGLHSIEVVYWDQGGFAKLKLELSDDAGTTYDILSLVPSYQQTVFSAVEDTALSLAVASLLGNDTDLDGDTLTIQSVQGAVNGTVSLVAGSVIFTPALNYSGPASFTYTVSDGKGGTDTATVNLAVAPVNDAPIAVANSGVAATNGSLSIPIATLLSNDSDVEGETISFVSAQGAVNGTVSVSGNNVVFTPTANYEGPASFTYTIRDPVSNTSNGSVTVNVGAASAPSVAVLKSVVALAHGTGGTSIKFPIATSLVDTDGSETLSIKVSGVPTGVSFNSGTNLGGGVWQFTTADLPNLMLNLPGSYTTTSTSLTVQVTSTEVSGGFTATTSSTLALRADYTTLDITTTESGNYTGTSANEYIQGGSGNNTISAGNGNNVVYAGDGNDTITAGGGYDVIFGGSGNDTINSGVGSDRISGGAGNDTLSGASDNFVDVFVWTLGDQGAAGTPAEDTINNFATNAPSSNTNGGDVLDLRDLLQGEQVGPSNGAGNLADYLHFEISGGNTIVHISHTGGFSGDSHTVGAGYTGTAETQKITLTGVNLQSLYSGATTDQQIITQLLNNNKLITD